MQGFAFTGRLENNLGQSSPSTSLFSTSAPYNARDATTYVSTPVTTPTHIARDGMIHGHSEVASETTRTLLKHCACEFLGTLALFLVTVLCNCASYFYIAFFYVGLIYAFWSMSGAHFNPAISFAMFLARRISLRSFYAYVFSQTVGAAIGGLLFHYIFLGAKLTVTLVPASPHTLANALFVQFVYTTMLTFVALTVTCTNGRNQYFGIAIGFVILAGGSVACAISKGVLFNPAFCVGLMVSSFEVGCCLQYALVELASAVVGAIFFKLFGHRHEFHSDASNDGGWYFEHSEQIAMFKEFLGTFWFVFTVCLNVGLQTKYCTLAGGGALISAIYALGHHGGCFNPAATLGLMLGGRNTLSNSRGFGYIIMQLLAAILAGVAAGVNSKAAGLYATSSSYGRWPIGFIEFSSTLVLAFVVLVVASRIHSWFDNDCALTIGFTYFGASAAASGISGGYLNPAVALAFAVDGQLSLPSFHGVGAICYYLKVFSYWIPEFLAGCVAALLLHWLYKEDYHHSYPVGALATPSTKAAPFGESAPPPWIEPVTIAAPTSFPTVSMPPVTTQHISARPGAPGTTASISSRYVV